MISRRRGKSPLISNRRPARVSTSSVSLPNSVGSASITRKSRSAISWLQNKTASARRMNCFSSSSYSSEISPTISSRISSIVTIPEVPPNSFHHDRHMDLAGTEFLQEIVDLLRLRHEIGRTDQTLPTERVRLLHIRQKVFDIQDSLDVILRIGINRNTGITGSDDEIDTVRKLVLMSISSISRRGVMISSQSCCRT